MNYFQWLKYHARWSLALLVAAVFSLWTRRGWVRIGKAFGLWFGLVRHPKDSHASPEVVQRRLKACESCALYFRHLQTCGTPLILNSERRKLGCWCFQPESAKLNAKRCYLDEFVEPGYPGGWDDAAARSHDSKRADGG